jgi:hypothetical protein
LGFGFLEPAPRGRGQGEGDAAGGYFATCTVPFMLGCSAQL